MYLLGHFVQTQVASDSDFMSSYADCGFGASHDDTSGSMGDLLVNDWSSKLWNRLGSVMSCVYKQTVDNVMTSGR